MALQRAGLFFNGGAVAYLTPGQKAVLLAELESMEVRQLDTLPLVHSKGNVHQPRDGSHQLTMRSGGKGRAANQLCSAMGT